MLKWCFVPLLTAWLLFSIAQVWHACRSNALWRNWQKRALKLERFLWTYCHVNVRTSQVWNILDSRVRGQSLLKFYFVAGWVIVNSEQCSRVLSKIQTFLQFDSFWRFSYWRPFHIMNTSKTFTFRGMIYSNFQEQRESRWPARLNGGHHTRWRDIGGWWFPVCRLLSRC